MNTTLSVEQVLRKYTLEDLLSIARVEENTLALAIHLALQDINSDPDKRESAAFDDGYNAGWEDALMRASNAIDQAIDELEK